MSRSLLGRLEADGDTMNVTENLQHPPDKTLGLRVAAVFVILSAGLLGGVPPLFIKALRNQESLPTFLIRAFSAGVILALGLVHILPDAVEELVNLGGVDYPLGGTCVLVGLFVMIGIEQGAHVTAHDMPFGHGRSQTEKPSEGGAQHGHSHEHGHGRGSDAVPRGHDHRQDHSHRGHGSHGRAGRGSGAGSGSAGDPVLLPTEAEAAEAEAAEAEVAEAGSGKQAASAAAAAAAGGVRQCSGGGKGDGGDGSGRPAAVAGAGAGLGCRSHGGRAVLSWERALSTTTPRGGQGPRQPLWGQQEEEQRQQEERGHKLQKQHVTLSCDASGRTVAGSAEAAGHAGGTGGSGSPRSRRGVGFTRRSEGLPTLQKAAGGGSGVVAGSLGARSLPLFARDDGPSSSASAGDSDAAALDAASEAARAADDGSAGGGGGGGPAAALAGGPAPRVARPHLSSPGPSGTTSTHCHDCVSCASAPNWASAVEAISEARAPIRLRIVAYLFELGCIFHSFIIGLSLGVNRTSIPQVRALLLALSFHQALEGLSLASVINGGGFSTAKAAAMVATYSVTCPLGVAIGVAIAASYDPDSTQARAAQGCLNGISGGMLLYISLVQLVAEDMGKYLLGPPPTTGDAGGGAAAAAAALAAAEPPAAGAEAAASQAALAHGSSGPPCGHGHGRGGAGAAGGDIGYGIRGPSFLAFCLGATSMCLLAVWA